MDKQEYISFFPKTGVISYGVNNKRISSHCFESEVFGMLELITKDGIVPVERIMRIECNVRR